MSLLDNEDVLIEKSSRFVNKEVKRKYFLDVYYGLSDEHSKKDILKKIFGIIINDKIKIRGDGYSSRFEVWNKGHFLFSLKWSSYIQSSQKKRHFEITFECTEKYWDSLYNEWVIRPINMELLNYYKEEFKKYFMKYKICEKDIFRTGMTWKIIDGVMREVEFKEKMGMRVTVMFNTNDYEKNFKK